ncbi:MAG: DUF2306 domain-containing protein [Acidobacteria bacterium]|nr:DUF2306 domain-containing protein [Acidobacteriota bacterium]
MKVVMLLVTLSLVPAAAAIFRLVTLASGHSTPETARFFDSPWPVVLHILAVVPYSLLGALQFAPSLRKNRWHRITGRLLTPLAMIAALTGLWMAHFYPWPPLDGQVVYISRLLAGSGMAVSVVLGIAAIVRRDYVVHGEWMTRGYALGMGAGTQVLTHLPWTLTVGMPGETGRAIAMASGWLINIVVAEYAIRRSRSRVTSRRSSATRLSSSGSRETQSLAR